MSVTPGTPSNYGEIFTKRWVVEAMLDLADYRSTADLSQRCALEPSVGSGAFWFPMLERLISSAEQHGVPFASLDGSLLGVDLQPQHVETCQAGTVSLLKARGCSADLAVKLAQGWLKPADFLLEADMPRADLVIGNPPYIRWDELSAEAAAEYRSRWSTMRGRVDIYVGFFQRGLELLRPGGTLSFICADRWMRNAYGADLRKFVSESFAVDVLWTMHDVAAFEAEVSAYPAIIQLGAHPQAGAVVADCSSVFDAASSSPLIEFSRRRDVGSRDEGPGYSAHVAHGWFEGPDLWPAGTPDQIAQLEELNERLPTIEETGVKVGIGVATGADKVYIVKQSSADVEFDRLLPMTMTDDVRSGKFAWGGYSLINPWTDGGDLVDLNEFPRMKAYLESFPQLRERFVAKKSPHKWHRTIDKVNASLTAQPKLLLQDMKAAITPVYEPGGHYPHHNLYYMTSSSWDLEVLGGLMLSNIAQSFIEAYGVRMRGGTLRFQSQYLRKIRVPHPDSISESDATRLRDAFRSGDRQLASVIARKVYGLPTS